MKTMSLGVKLIIFFLLVGLIPFGIIGITSYTKSSNALSDAAYGQLKGMRAVKKAQITQFFDERQGDMGVLMETVGTLRKEAFDKLGAIRDIKKSQIQGFFNERMGDARVLADSPFIVEAFKALDEAFNAAGGADSGQFKGYTNGKFDAPYAYKQVHENILQILVFTWNNMAIMMFFLSIPSMEAQLLQLRKKLILVLTSPLWILHYMMYGIYRLSMVKLLFLTPNPTNLQQVLLLNLLQLLSKITEK